MTERPRFFDDLAGVAGGAFSAMAGLRDELETMVRSRADEAIRKLDLVKRDELDAVHEMAATARAGQDAAEARLVALETRLAALEAKTVAGTGTATDTAKPVPMRPTGPSVDGTELPPIALPAGGEAGSPNEPPSID